MNDDACVYVCACACEHGCMWIRGVVVFVVVVFYVRRPHGKLDWYMQYFINDVCTCLSNCVTFVK